MRGGAVLFGRHMAFLFFKAPVLLDAVIILPGINN